MLKKILKVFTKEYREETQYREFLEKYFSKHKLKGTNTDIEENIKLLQDKNYESNFKIKLNC